MTGSSLQEPLMSPQVQALYDEDLADGAIAPARRQPNNAAESRLCPVAWQPIRPARYLSRQPLVPAPCKRARRPLPW
jgi:hypothetical protein